MKKAFVSWSGGKDSALACYNAMKNGETEIAYLLSMLSEDGTHSRSHHLRGAILKSQAEAMNIPIVLRQATWQGYEEEFKKALALFKEENVQTGIFGDIDVQEHRDWVERVSKESGLDAVLPLWQRSRESLMSEFITAGFKAIIVTVNLECMGGEWLGRQLDREFVKEIRRFPQVDLCGENGEYHTFVYDGPVFKKPVVFAAGEKVLKDNHCFLELEAKR
jgi:uncharacterized protein (TIGR00290 family)